MDAQILLHEQLFRCRAAIFLLMLLAWLAVPAAAYGCGMPLGARIPSEQALIVFAGGHEEIISSVQLMSDKPGAAVIFPVPGVPQVSALPSDTLFGYLGEVTRPEEREEEVFVWGKGGQEGALAGGAPVDVLGREIIGGYDVARL